MADLTDIHPLLQAEEDDRLAQEAALNQPAAAQPEPLTLEPVIPELPPEAAPVADDEDRHFIKFDRRQNLNQQLRKVIDEDQEFGQAASTVAGRRAKRDADTRIAQLQAELEEYKFAAIATEIDDMLPAARLERVEKDPNFRQVYNKYLERQQKGAPDVNQATEQAYYASKFDELMERADLSLAPARVKLYADGWSKCLFCEAAGRDGTKHGSYDHDENGVFYSQKYGVNTPVTNRARFDRMAELLNGEVEQAKLSAANERAARRPAPVATATVPPPPAAPPRPAAAPPFAVGAPNPRLQHQPETALAAARPGGSKNVITSDEYHAMGIEDRIKRWPSPGDYERAVDAGEVLIPGINS